MFKFPKIVLAIAISLSLASAFAQSTKYPGVGRDATPKEVAAWDIDVRPDFKGLPAGAGSVDRGTEVWESKCASCHGVFGESNEVFTPLVGGTTAKDIETGHVANLLPGKNFPQRTTMMKVATVSTLWDYINRAMPWNAPKSLSTDDVYAVLAYLLNLAEVVPADYVLSDKNIADVQKRMPNRNGMTVYTPLWDVKGKGDVQNVACMKNCVTELTLGSSLPDFARDAHGDINKQNRIIGPVRGAVTKLPLKEFELLYVLVANAGRVLTRETLIDRVWGTDYYGDTKTLDVHIKRLRSKIESEPANPTRLVTIRGLGYKYEKMSA